MIVVKIELWPFGSSENIEEIGRMYIANVGGNAKRGNYQVAVCRRGHRSLPNCFRSSVSNIKPSRTGSVVRYPRLSYNVWRLITRALKSCFPEEA